MPIPAGTRLGPYEVVAPLGSGGMGEVYRARDAKLGRDVAVKILPAEFALDPERVARFKREAQVLASLNHPNIAAIYGLEGTDGQDRQEGREGQERPDGHPLALVLEFVDGPTLADRIAQGPIPIDEALPIAGQIAEALEAAHEQGIIHRDLKPANIKVRLDGTVKVLDFGLAKLTDAAAQAGRAGQAGWAGAAALSQSPTITTPAMMTGVGTILGTAAYMSPEQAKGRPADKRSDLWAFGCVLYEMLTGRRPFEGEDVSETLASVLKSQPDWTRWTDEVPAPVRVLIERCLAKDRRDRIGDVSTVRFVLAEASNMAPRAMGADSGSNRGGSRWASPIRIAGAVLATASLAAAAGWYLRPAPPSPKVARFWLKVPQEDKATPVLGGRQVLAISPDATRVAYVSNERMWLRSLSQFDSGTAVSTGTITVHSPAFSPDGGSVAFYSGSEMRRVAFTGGTPVSICAVASPFGVSWDVTGILIGQGSAGVVRCSPNGGASEQIAKVQPGELAQGPQMLPDGRHVLFTIGTGTDRASVTSWDQARIVVHDVKSGEQKTVLTGGSDGRYVPTGHLLYAVGGVLLAVPFDVRRLETTGSPAPVLEGVARSRGGTTGIAHIAVSSGGSLLYMLGPVKPSNSLLQPALSDRAGNVTPLRLPPGPYVHVRASHDGKRLALGSDDGRDAIVWIYDVDGARAIRRLTLDGKNRFPLWSPGGDRVAFQSDRDGDLAIFAQRPDGTGVAERLTKPEKGETHVPGAWSPDGGLLAFAVIKEGSQALWTLSMADRKVTPFGNVVSAEPLEPAFSPDGRWIAYSASPPNTGLSTNRGIYVQPVPATGARYQAPKQQLDFQPVWSRDGRELMYVPSAASGRLVSVRVVTQPSLSFGAPELFPAKVTAERTSSQPRAFDVLPDGRFAGLIGSVETPGNPEFRVILNWFEELKQRVPIK